MEEKVTQSQPQFKKRGEGKNTADCLSDDIYKYYCEKYGNKFNLTKAQFRLILKDLNDAKFKHIINKAWTFRIPARLGDIRIRKRKVLFKLNKDGELDTKYLNVDYNETNKLWARDPKAKKEKRLIFHFNEHTDGYKFPWFWDKRTSNAEGQTYYKVIITRTHNREKSHALKTNSKLDYYV